MNISWGNLNKIGGLHQFQYLGFDIIPKFCKFYHWSKLGKRYRTIFYYSLHVNMQPSQNKKFNLKNILDYLKKYNKVYSGG